MTQSQSPTCFPPECVTTINEGGTGYSHSDRQTGWDDPGLGHHSGWRNPAWADDDTVILSDPTHLPNRDVVLDTISDGPPGLAHPWMTDAVEGNPHVGGGDITRDKRKLAFVTGENDTTLTLYYAPVFPTVFTDGEPPAGSDPYVCYRYSGPTGGKFGTPSFAPDGRHLAWGDAARHHRRRRAGLLRVRRLHAGRRDARHDRDPGRRAARLGPGRRAARTLAARPRPRPRSRSGPRSRLPRRVRPG